MIHSSQICDTSVTDVAMGDDENQEDEDEPVPGTPPAKRVSLWIFRYPVKICSSVGHLITILYRKQPIKTGINYRVGTVLKSVYILVPFLKRR
jgi:hypothetical protein